LLPTLGAILDFGSVLGHLNPHRRHIKHLTFFVAARRHPLKVRGTVGTSRSFVNLDMIRFLNLLEGMSFVAFLAAATTSCFLTQTPCARFLQAIATRWLAAVPAILGQLVLQGLDHDRLFSHLLFQDAHLLLQHLDDGDQGSFV
jgi:hypothetical protein